MSADLTSFHAIRRGGRQRKGKGAALISTQSHHGQLLDKSVQDNLIR